MCRLLPAQSIAPGKSLELVNEELHRVKALGSWPKTIPTILNGFTRSTSHPSSCT